MERLLWLGAALGTTFIVTRSSLFAPVRAWFPKKKGSAPFFGTLLRCPKCFGTWMGALWALLIAAVNGAAVGSGTLVIEFGDTAFAHPAPWLIVVYALAYGTSGAACCWLADLVFRKLGGDKVLSFERHPWQDLPQADKAMVMSLLREGEREHLGYAKEVHDGKTSRPLRDQVEELHEERARVYATALDLLGP